MHYQSCRRLFVSFVFVTGVLFSGLTGAFITEAKTIQVAGQDTDWQQDKGPNKRERGRMCCEEHQELNVVRELDREHRLRFRMNNQVKAVGYIDNFGGFHYYGYYDPWGFFHRY